MSPKERKRLTVMTAVQAGEFKPTCQVGKVLTVLNTLGIEVKLAPSTAGPHNTPDGEA